MNKEKALPLTLIEEKRLLELIRLIDSGKITGLDKEYREYAYLKAKQALYHLQEREQEAK